MKSPQNTSQYSHVFTEIRALCALLEVVFENPTSQSKHYLLCIHQHRCLKVIIRQASKTSLWNLTLITFELFVDFQTHRINHPLGYFHPVNAYQSRLKNISALRTFNTRSCSVLFSLCAIPDKYCNIQYELCHSPSTEDLGRLLKWK